MVGFREVPLLKVIFSFMVFSQKSRRHESNVHREKKKIHFYSSVCLSTITVGSVVCATWRLDFLLLIHGKWELWR